MWAGSLWDSPPPVVVREEEPLDEMQWLNSDYSRGLFRAIGLRAEDFVGLQGIAESEVTDRIVVWCKSISDQCHHVLGAENLHRVRHNEEGYTEFFFNRLPSAD